MVTAAISGCSRQSAASSANKEGATLRFGYFGAYPTGTVGWALERGLLQPALAKIGITHVELFSGGSGPQLNEAFAAHSIDAYITGDTPGIIGRSVGLPLRLINLDVTHDHLRLITAPDGPKTVDELVGKRIPVYQGTNQMHYVYGVLTEHGILDKVQIVNMSLSGDAVSAALQRGDIAAASVQNAAVYLARGFRAIDSSWDHPGLSGNSPIVASEDFVTAHPDFPRVFNEVRAQAVADIKAHPDAYYDYLAKHFPYPRDLLPDIYPLSTLEADPFPAGSLEALDGLKKFLIDQHIVRTDFSINDWVAPGAQSAAPASATTSVKAASGPAVVSGS